LDLEFDEGSGTDTYDSSGNRNNGTLYNDTFHSFGGNLFECSNPPTNGCPKWVDGKFGKAIEFDSSYDYVEVPDSASLDSITNTKDATWVFWFKLKTLNFPDDYPTFLGKNFTDIYKEYTIRINNGSAPLFTKVLTFRLANGTDSEGMNCSKTDWNVGEWYHVTVNYMNATKNANIYIDGVTCRSYDFTYNGLLTDNVATLFIGDSTENYGFNGTIDDVRIFNKALTPDETVSLTLGELT
jgi:hypothetical protein